MPKVDLLVVDKLIISVFPDSQLGDIGQLYFHHFSKGHLVSSITESLDLEMITVYLLNAGLVSVRFVELRTNEIIFLWNLKRLCLSLHLNFTNLNYLGLLRIQVLEKVLGLSIGFFVEAIDPSFLLTAIEAHLLRAVCVLFHHLNYSILNLQVGKKYGGLLLCVFQGVGVSRSFLQMKVNSSNKPPLEITIKIKEAETNEQVLTPYKRGIAIAKNVQLHYDKLYDVYELHDLADSQTNKRTFFHKAKDLQLERNQPPTEEVDFYSCKIVKQRAKHRLPIFQRSTDAGPGNDRRAEIIARDSFIDPLISDSQESTIFYTCRSYDSED